MEEEGLWYEVGSYNELTSEQRKAMVDAFDSELPAPPRGLIPTICPHCREYIDVGELFGVIHGTVVICKDCYQFVLNKEEKE